MSAYSRYLSLFRTSWPWTLVCKETNTLIMDVMFGVAWRPGTCEPLIGYTEWRQILPNIFCSFLFQASRKATKNNHPPASLWSKESKSYSPDLEHVFSTAIASLVASLVVSPIFIIVRRVNLPSSVLAQTVCKWFLPEPQLLLESGLPSRRNFQRKEYPKSFFFSKECVF